MPGDVNYKNKYMELRAKYMSDLDMAFRIGVEQGVQQAQQDQMAQQQADAAAMEANMNGQNMDPNQTQQSKQVDQDPVADQPSELDQHIAKLEGMLSGSKDPEIKKSLDDLVTIRKAELQAIQLKKSEQAIKGIVKALHKPAFKMGVQAQHNLYAGAKAAVSMQHKIVNDVMSKMEEEEKKASKDIKDILNVEGLTKG